MTKLKVAVVGGGPAGCTAAYTLGKQGHDIVLFESQNQVGGRTSQIQREGFNLGSGALFLMGDLYPRTNAIIRELGHSSKLVKWDAKTVIIDADGQRYTANFSQVATFLKIPVLDLFDKLKAITGIGAQILSPGPDSGFDGEELAKFDKGIDLKTWSDMVLGEKGTNYITYPYMGFLYAVPLEWMSTPLFQYIVQNFYKMDLYVPEKGVGQFSDWLIEGSKRLDLHLSSPVDTITKKEKGFMVTSLGKSYDVDAVIVSSEPGVAADLLTGIISEDATSKLRNCRYSEYAHVHVAYKKNPWPEHPASVGLPANDLSKPWGATVLLSRRHPNSVPPGGEAVCVYFYTPPLEKMSPEDIEKEALKAVKEVYGEGPEPDFIHTFYYKRGLSIAGPGHYATINTLHKELPEGVFLAGDYFAHAGVEAAVISGEKAANRLIAKHA